MMSSPTALSIATAAGLEAKLNAPDELVAHCPEADLARKLGHLVQEMDLADLFATTVPGRNPRLTAVLEVPGDRSWLVVHSDLSQAEFPSLAAISHAASWYERDILEMHGLVPQGHPAPHPLRQGEPSVIDRAHGERHHQSGLGLAPRTARRPAVTGQGVFELPLGPVRSGPQESGGFTFFSGGEDIVITDMTLGFKFRAIKRIAEGRSPENVIPLAERLAGTSSFANALAFARAVERVLGTSASLPEQFTRTLFAELERTHSHLGVIGHLAEATGLQVAAAQYSMLREDVLRAAGRLAGHRYLRGIVRIGGTAIVPSPSARSWLRSQVGAWRSQTQRLHHLLQETSTFVDRLETTAFLKPAYAAEHNLVGPVGRASGIDHDVRRDHPYGAYPRVQLLVPVLSEGDAKARFVLHAMELEQSFAILAQLLETWPDDSAPVPAPAVRSGSALGWAEAPGGETVHFVALDERGLVTRWRARPPAVVNWHPFAHACASGNNLTDFPVIEASFGLSHAEFDR